MSETHDEQPESDHDLLLRIAAALDQISTDITYLTGVVENLNERDPYDD